MSLKIIAGEFRGRKLITLPGLETRPTANRTREALFNILAFKLNNAVVLDLFAGSGALGLEALSRGAQSVTFVEQNRRACEVIARNIALCRAESRAKVVCMPVENFGDTAGKYHVALMDPPYGKNLADMALSAMAKGGYLRPGALVAAEHETKRGPVYDAGVYRFEQTRAYGRGAVSFYVYNPLKEPLND